MGSRTFDGVRFTAYSDDHPPPHVHGFYAGVRVIFDLNGGLIELSSRDDAVTPRNAKQSDVKRVLRIALKFADELVELWTVARG